MYFKFTWTVRDTLVDIYKDKIWDVCMDIRMDNCVDKSYFRVKRRCQNEKKGVLDFVFNYVSSNVHNSVCNIVSKSVHKTVPRLSVASPWTVYRQSTDRPRTVGSYFWSV